MSKSSSQSSSSSARPPKPRTATVKRATNETQISVTVNLDGTGKCRGSLGVPFFEHMLDLFARHSLIDLEISGKGDLEIDSHHTVEDAGITLGQAVKEALGDRAGIERYGEAYVPMEETIVRCALDLCNRPYLRYDVPVPKAKIGDFDAELAEEFFRAFVMNAGITMHMKLLEGSNLHHVLEAAFKSAGRALGKALLRNSRIRGVLSTKGKL